MALVIMGRALGHPGQQRQDRRGSIQRLDLALLINTEHDRTLGRVQVQADNVTDLFDDSGSRDNFQDP